ncbi:MAG: anti-sigma factor family protein [Gemmatimonas sp.]
MPHSDMNEREDEMWTDGHPDEGLLHEWLDEQLNATDAEHVASHVQSCAQCQSAVAEARGLIAASHRILAKLDEVPAGVIPQNFETAPAPPTTSVDPKVTSIDTAKPRTANKSAFRWQRVAPIAALLLVAVIYARSSDKAASPAVDTNEAPVAATASAPAAGVAMRSELSADSTVVATDAALPAPNAAERGSLESAPLRARANAGGGSASASAGRTQLAETGLADAERKDVARKAEAVIASEMAAPAPTVAKTSAPITANAAEPELTKRTLAAPPAPPPSAVSATLPPAPAPQNAAASPPVTPPVGAGGELGARFRTPARDAAAGAAVGVPMASPPVILLVPDTVILVRNVCTATCEASTLQISALGVVRLTVSAGSTERTVTSQLSVQQRASLDAITRRVSGSPRARAYRCIVSGSSRESAPAVQIDVLYPTPVPIGEARCTQTASEISELAREIDAIVGTELLRQRLRP